MGDREQAARDRLADLKAPREEELPDVDPLRGRALAAAARAYTAAHGHPLDHRTDPPASGARWILRPRALRAAAAALAVLVVLVVLRPVMDGPVQDGDARGSTLVEEGAAASPTGVQQVWPPEPDTARGDVPGAGPGTGAGVPPTGTPPTATTELVVHVVGQVNRPGVVRLPAGARVEEALRAAGGASADADLAAVNLARVLVDGEQLRVPAPGEPPPELDAAGGTTGPSGVPAAPTGALDLNRADAAALDSLPGVGPVLAERILAWRAANGQFSSVEELAEVSGIGPRVLEGLRELVTVG